jgi:Predicted amidohydrolase
MSRKHDFVLAAAQAAPIFFDRDASLEKAVRAIENAAAQGADVVAFGESWLPGYPFFIDAPLNDAWWEAAADYAANCIDIPGPETDALCAAAKAGGIDVVIGVGERHPLTQGTLFAPCYSSAARA